MKLPFHKLAGETGSHVVMIHGFGADRLSWMANAPALSGYQVWGVDLPGHGEAEPVAAAVIKVFARLVAETIASHLQGRFHLIGHSLGGAVALELAQLTPQAISSLILIAPAGLGERIEADFVTQFPQLFQAAEAEIVLHKLVARPRLINRFMVSRVLEHLDRPGRRAALAAIAEYLVLLDDQLDEAIAAISVNSIPHLTIWGAKDSVNPMNRSKLEEFGGETLILPEAGHMPQIEEARAVNAAILAFLGLHY